MTDKVLTANHRLSGEVVFLAEGELWTPTIDEALVATSAEEEAWFAAAGARAVAVRTVIDPRLVEVERRNGAARPARLRETPMHRGARPDLGKQAA